MVRLVIFISIMFCLQGETLSKTSIDEKIKHEKESDEKKENSIGNEEEKDNDDSDDKSNLDNPKGCYGNEDENIWPSGHWENLVYASSVFLP